MKIQAIQTCHDYDILAQKETFTKYTEIETFE